MKSLVVFTLLIGAAVHAQIAPPDSAAVVNNKVKVARIYQVQNIGERHLAREIHYDAQGRVIYNRDGESTNYYYAFDYDDSNRVHSSTQRSLKGECIQKFVNVYHANGSKTITLYLRSDTTTPAYIYTYDSANRKIHETDFVSGNILQETGSTYDESGKLIGSYDSSSSARVANYRLNDNLVLRRTYDINGQLLHQYRYQYNAMNKVVSVVDSSGPKKPIHYEIEYAPNGSVIQYRRNAAPMNDKEIAQFRQDFYYLFPEDNLQPDYGLPVPEMLNKHEFTYDEKGNIIKDKLTQVQGSFSQSYFYVYEYEFY